MLEAIKKDKSTELNLITRIKRNANVMKNYQGKMKGLKSIQLANDKKQEDAALVAFINENAELKVKYGTLMTDIDNLYKDIFADAERTMWFSQIYSSSNLLNISRYLNSFKTALKSSQDQANFFNANLPQVKQALESMYANYDFQVDSTILTKMLSDASHLPSKQSITAVSNLGKGSKSTQEFVKKTLNKTKLKDQQFVLENLLAAPDKLLNYSDDLMQFQSDIQNQLSASKPEQDRREGILNKLMGDYVAVKEQFQNKDFIPDANSTLRLTFGYVRGYSPADATYVTPFTTIRGIIEKGSLNDNPDYQYPQKIRDAWEAKNFGSYAMEELDDVPVNLLYNMDTTGGNSGSPIMNSKGELIGVNFDRAYDATINDFAWNESYSRSIGVDIRYVLWVADKIDNADFLLREIGL